METPPEMSQLSRKEYMAKMRWRCAQRGREGKSRLLDELCDVYGKLDALGAEPEKNPIGPEDLARTMYRLLGINASKRLVLDGVRPIDIVNGGRLIQELIA